MMSYKMYVFVLLIVIKFTFALNAFDHLKLTFKVNRSQKTPKILENLTFFSFVSMVTI